LSFPAYQLKKADAEWSADILVRKREQSSGHSLRNAKPVRAYVLMRPGMLALHAGVRYADEL
jgi:hypothetical protein